MRITGIGCCLIAVLVLLMGELPLYAPTNYMFYLERGMENLTKDYDSDAARRNFIRIINAPAAPERIKVRAYFWKAYSYLFDGMKNEVKSTFKEMFEFKNDITYKFDSGIDETLLNNGELMRLYDMEYRKFYNTARDLIIDDMDNSDPAPKINYITRILILSGVVVVALIVSFI